MSDSRPVSSRRVFYIPGYDPFPPRRYRELYRKEGEDQAEMSGYELELSARHGGENYGWTVEADIEGGHVKTQYEVLVWSDIVRDSMETGIAGTYLQMVRTSWTYITSGALRRLMWLRKGPVIAALYPVGMLLLQALVVVIAAAIIGKIASRLIHPGVGWIVALPVIIYGLRWFRGLDGRLYAYYLMHDFAFSAQHNGATPPALEERMDQFGRQIAAALASDADEVLVVGHSSGAHLVVSILADLIRNGHLPPKGPTLSFLSLGQVIPMVSFLPMARQLRADLNLLSQSSALSWVDVSAPGDGCSFALCDPVAVSGVAPENRKWPLVISAAYSQTLSNARWQELRWRFFRLHFQYLCAFDDAGDYDYFRITAGPRTLVDRFAGRAPSKSRIDVPASPYRSMAA